MDQVNFSTQHLTHSSVISSKANILRIEGKCVSCFVALFEGVDKLPWHIDDFKKWLQWETLIDQQSSLQSVSFLVQSLFSIEMNKTKFETTERNLRDESASSNNNWAAFVYHTNTHFSNWLQSDEPTDLFRKQLSVRLALMGHSLSAQSIDWWWKHVVWMCESPNIVISWMKRQVALLSLEPTYAPDPTFSAWKMLFSEYNSSISLGTRNIALWSLLFKVAYLHSKVDEILLKSSNEHQSFAMMDLLQHLVNLVYFISRLFSLEEVNLSRQIDNKTLYNKCVACITKLVQHLLHNDSELTILLRYQSTNSKAPLRDFLKSWIVDDVVPTISMLSEYLNPMANAEKQTIVDESDSTDTQNSPSFNFPVGKQFSSVPGLTIQEFMWMVETDPSCQRKLFQALLLGTPPPSSPDWIQFGDSDVWKRTFADYSLRQREKMQLPVECNNQLIPSKDTAFRYREYSYVRRFSSTPTERKIWETQVLYDKSDVNHRNCYHCSKPSTNHTYCAICGQTFCNECIFSQQGFHRLRPFYIREIGTSCYFDSVHNNMIQDITLFFCGRCPPFWAVIEDQTKRKRLHALDARPPIAQQQQHYHHQRPSLHQSLNLRPSQTVVLSDLESTDLARVNM